MAKKLDTLTGRTASTLAAATLAVVAVLAGMDRARERSHALDEGVDADYEAIRDWAVQDGAFFTAEDVFARRKVALLGTVADALFPGESPVGRRIQVRDTLLDVMGVLAPKGQMSSGQDQDDVVLMPYTTAQARLSGQVRIPQMRSASAWPSGRGTRT